jgi:hypothetical protein
MAVSDAESEAELVGTVTAADGVPIAYWRPC